MRLLRYIYLIISSRREHFSNPDCTDLTDHGISYEYHTAEKVQSSEYGTLRCMYVSFHHDVDDFLHHHLLVPDGEGVSRGGPMMALDEQPHDDVVQSQDETSASTCRTTPRASTQSLVSIVGELIFLEFVLYSSI